MNADLFSWPLYKHKKGSAGRKNNDYYSVLTITAEWLCHSSKESLEGELFRIKYQI